MIIIFGTILTYSFNVLTREIGFQMKPVIFGQGVIKEEIHL